MNTKSILLLLSLAIFTMSCVSLDGALKRGTKELNDRAYIRAIPHFKQALKKDSNNVEALTKIGECYRLINDNKNAEKTYSKLATLSSEPINKYYYGKALMANGKYEQSKPILEKYQSAVSSDVRGAKSTEGLKDINKFFKDSSNFKINFLDFNSTEADLCPVLFKNELVFTSSRPKARIFRNVHSWTDRAFYFLYRSSKNDATGSYAKPKSFAKSLATKYYDGPVSFSNDSKEIFLTRNNVTDGKAIKGTNDEIKLKIMQGSVDEEGNYTESTLKNLPFNNDNYNVCHPSISTDGQKLYFSSDMPGGQGGMDLYVAEKIGTTWGTPKNLGTKINTKGNEVFPFVDNTGILFFSSNGLDGLGELDIYAIPAKSTNSTPLNIGAPMNSRFDDFGMSYDGVSKKGYFTSNRKNGELDDDIYSLIGYKPFKFGKQIKGVAKDKEGNILAGTVVNLFDSKGKVIETVTTQADGNYAFDVNDDDNYKLTGDKDKFFPGKNNADTKDRDVTIADLVLEKDPGLALRLLVSDGKTKEPMNNVKAKITNTKTGEVFIEDLTPASGDLMKALANNKVGDELTYKIELLKEGYFPKTVNFNHVVKKPGIVNVHELLEGGLSMDKEVKDLRDLVVINDIRFDLNKFNIRPDAAIELDKVIEVMNKYPGMVIELGSHTDCRASIKYNETLSDKRAKASAAYIKTKIANPTRINGKGYGESRLLNGCACEGTVKSTCSEDEHQKNRRTEFLILSMGAGTDKVDVKNNSTNSFKK